jgi:hypothetical protein
MGLNAQVAELRDAFDTLQAEVSAVAERVAAAIASLEARVLAAGEVDPDLQADIDEVKATAEQLKGIAVAPAPEPEDDPTA